MRFDQLPKLTVIQLAGILAALVAALDQLTAQIRLEFPNGCFAQHDVAISRMSAGSKLQRPRILNWRAGRFGIAQRR